MTDVTPHATVYYKGLQPLHPYPTATCPDCGHTRRIIKARSRGTETRYLLEGQYHTVSLPPGARHVQVWFDCGHEPRGIVTSHLEELGISIDKRGCAQPWSKEGTE